MLGQNYESVAKEFYFKIHQHRKKICPMTSNDIIMSPYDIWYIISRMKPFYKLRNCNFDKILQHLMTFIFIWCQLISQYSNTSVFQYLYIPISQFLISFIPKSHYPNSSIIPISQYSNTSIFQYLNIPTSQYSSISIFQYFKIPISQYSNISQ